MAPPPASIKHGRWVTAESDVAFGVHKARGATTSRRKDPPLWSGAAVTPGRRRAAGAAVWTTTEITRRRRATGPRAVAGAASRPQLVPSPSAGTGGSSDGGRKERIRIRKEATGLCGWNHAWGLLGQRACTAKEDPASVERAAWRGGGGGGEGSCCGREQWRPFVAVCIVSAERAGPRGGTGQPYAGQTALWGQSQAEGLGPGLSAARTTPSAGGPRRAARGGSRVPVGQSAWRRGCPEGGSGNPGWTRRKGG